MQSPLGTAVRGLSNLSLLGEDSPASRAEVGSLASSSVSSSANASNRPDAEAIDRKLPGKIWTGPSKHVFLKSRSDSAAVKVGTGPDGQPPSEELLAGVLQLPVVSSPSEHNRPAADWMVRSLPSDEGCSKVRKVFFTVRPLSLGVTLAPSLSSRDAKLLPELMDLSWPGIISAGSCGASTMFSSSSCGDPHEVSADQMASAA